MTKSVELKYYEQKEVWTNYNNNVGEIRRAENVVRLIPEDVKSLLDVGCGNGIITNMIKKPFVVGLDFARIPLNQVKTNKIQGTIDQLPIKSNEFDLIILTEVLEHLENKIYIKATNEIKRLRAKYILISVPFNENIEIDLCKCSVCGNLFNVFHHYRKFSDSWFSTEFPEYELIKIEYKDFGTPPLERLISIGQKFGIYLYSDIAVCNKCGNRPIRPNQLLGYVFRSINFFDKKIKRIFKIQTPYHMILLLRRLS